MASKEHAPSSTDVQAQVRAEIHGTGADRDSVADRFADLPVRRGPLREVRNLKDPDDPTTSPGTSLEETPEEIHQWDEYFNFKVKPKLKYIVIAYEAVPKDSNEDSAKENIVKKLFFEANYDIEAQNINYRSLSYINGYAPELTQRVFGTLADTDYTRLIDEAKLNFFDGLPEEAAKYKKKIDDHTAGLSNRARYVWLHYFNIHAPNGRAYTEQRSMAAKLHAIDENFSSDASATPEFRFMRGLLIDKEATSLRVIVKNDIIANGDLLIEQYFRDVPAPEFARTVREFITHFSTLLQNDIPRKIESLIRLRSTHAESDNKWRQGPGHKINADRLMQHEELFGLLDWDVPDADLLNPSTTIPPADERKLSKYVSDTVAIMFEVNLAKPTLQECVKAAGLDPDKLWGNMVVRTIEMIGVVPTVGAGEKGTDKARLAESLIEGRGFIPGLVTASVDRFAQYGVPYFTYLREQPSRERWVTLSKGEDLFGGTYGGNLINFFGDNEVAFFNRPLADQLLITKQGKTSLNDYFYRLDKLKTMDGKLGEIMKNVAANASNKDFFLALSSLEGTDVFGYMGNQDDVLEVLSPLYEISDRRVATNARSGTLEGGDLVVGILKLEPLGLGRLGRQILNKLAGNDTRLAIGNMPKEDYIRFLLTKLAGIKREQLIAQGITDPAILGEDLPGVKVLLEINPQLRAMARAEEWLLRHVELVKVNRGGEIILERGSYGDIPAVESADYQEFIAAFDAWVNRDQSMENQDKTPEWDKKLPFAGRPDQVRRIVNKVIMEIMHYGPNGFKGARHAETVGRAATRMLLPYHPYIIWATSHVVSWITNPLWERSNPARAEWWQNAKVSDSLGFIPKFFDRFTSEEKKKEIAARYRKYMIEHPGAVGRDRALRNIWDTYLFRMPYIAGPVIDPVAFLNGVHQMTGDRTIGVGIINSQKKFEEAFRYVKEHRTVCKTRIKNGHRVELTDEEMKRVKKVVHIAGLPDTIIDFDARPDNEKLLVVRGADEVLRVTTNPNAPGVMDAMKDPRDANNLLFVTEALPLTGGGHLQVLEAIRDMKEGTQFITLHDLVHHPENISMEMIDVVEGLSVGSGVMEYPEPSMRPQFIFNDVEVFVLDKLARNTKYFWGKIAKRSIPNAGRLRPSVLAKRIADVMYQNEYHRFFDNAADVRRLVERLSFDSLLSGNTPNEILMAFGAVGKLIRGGVNTGNEEYSGQPGLESLAIEQVGDPHQSLQDLTEHSKAIAAQQETVGSNLGELAASVTPVAQNFVKRGFKAIRSEVRNLPFIIPAVYYGTTWAAGYATSAGLTGLSWFVAPVGVGIAAVLYLSDRRGDKYFTNWHNYVRRFSLFQHVFHGAPGLDGVGPSIAMTDSKHPHDHIDTVWNARAAAVGALDTKK
ncbi:MAG: hypothetical protein M3Q44_01160 [bacterium]|nr:hypothetical protein [bacterium]